MAKRKTIEQKFGEFVSEIGLSKSEELIGAIKSYLEPKKSKKKQERSNVKAMPKEHPDASRSA